MTNIDPDNGIAYGYISANALEPELVDQMMYGPGADNISYGDALATHLAIERRACEEAGTFFDEGYHHEQFAESYENDNPIVEGEVPVDGYGVVHYRSSWLGGALNFFILKSPFVTDNARRASPCVPNAGILDTLDGSITSYDVPADWRVPA
jgi:hypothetical protein